MQELTLFSTFGTSVYAPGIFQVMAKFHVSRTVALLALAVYALGIGKIIFLAV